MGSRRTPPDFLDPLLDLDKRLSGVERRTSRVTGAEWQPILQASGYVPGNAISSSYSLWWGGDITNPPAGIPPTTWVDPDDTDLVGKVSEYRLRAQVYTNVTATGAITIVPALYPFTSGGVAGSITLTRDTRVVKSDVTFTNPATDDELQDRSAVFSLDVANRYLLGVATTGVPGANSRIGIAAQLQRRLV